MNRNIKQSGFGLVEVLISAMILTTMLGSAVALGNLSINRVVNAQNRLVAYGLANDAVEQIIAIRNRAYIDSDPDISGILTEEQTNTLTSSGYSAGLPRNPGSTNYVLADEAFGTIKFNSTQIAKLEPSQEMQNFFYYASTDNNYTISQTALPTQQALNQPAPTVFKRIISLAYDDTAKGVIVEVVVEWSEAGQILASGQKNKVTQKIVLTDWQSGLGNG